MCHYTEETINNTSFRFVSDLFHHWRKSPPESWLLRWQLGYREQPEQSPEEQNMRELPMFMPAVGKTGTLSVPKEVAEYLGQQKNA